MPGIIQRVVCVFVSFPLIREWTDLHHLRTAIGAAVRAIPHPHQSPRYASCDGVCVAVHRRLADHGCRSRCARCAVCAVQRLRRTHRVSAGTRRHLPSRLWIKASAPGSVDHLCARVQELVSLPASERHTTFAARRATMLSDKIDCAQFLTYFIENYPQSVAEVRAADEKFWQQFK